MLFTVLNIVVRNNAGLRERVLGYAVTDVGAFGTIIVQNIQGFHETGPALVIGVLLTVYGARRVAGAMQNALNSAWEVPRSERPQFPWNYLRSVALVLLVGLGAIAGGCVWQALQLVGGFYIVHALAHSRSLYGQTFGVVLGLLAWLFVQGEATLWVIEANVVWVRRLWPRSLAPPPLTKEDVKAYELYAQAEDRQGETIKVDVTSLPGAGPEDEKMPGRAEGAPARSDLPPVSATTARGEEAHDSGEDR